MRRLAVLLLVLMLAGGTLRAEETAQPRLEFTIDGKDLIITAKVSVNASPHVVWTHAADLGKEVHLYYQVIQLRDRLVRGEDARSRKEVELKWKLTDVKPGDKVYHVRTEFMPSAAELKELLPKLEKLIADGAK